MKNSIIKGLCVFFMLLSLLVLAVPAAASAQSGHGGSTEVIARVEPEATAATEETQPLPTEPEPADTHPVQTGEVVAWCAVAALVASGAVMLTFGLKSNKDQER